MHQLINKKILIYLFIFFSLGTYNNQEFSKLSLPRIDNYKIIGLSESTNKQIHQELSNLQNQTLFFLKKKQVKEIINKHKIVESFFVFKNYPSNLNIKIEKTNFLALTKINGFNFYIGSNGNFIEAKSYNIDLPFLFGDIEIIEFLKLKKIIDDSNFNYADIKNLFYFKSKRWDIETKDNLIIKLPIDKLKTSFEILSKIYKNDKFKHLNIIDLRQENLVILNG